MALTQEQREQVEEAFVKGAAVRSGQIGDPNLYISSKYTYGFNPSQRLYYDQLVENARQGNPVKKPEVTSSQSTNNLPPASAQSQISSALKPAQTLTPPTNGSPQSPKPVIKQNFFQKYFTGGVEIEYQSQQVNPPKQLTPVSYIDTNAGGIKLEGNVYTTGNIGAVATNNEGALKNREVVSRLNNQQGTSANATPDVGVSNKESLELLNTIGVPSQSIKFNSIKSSISQPTNLAPQQSQNKIGDNINLYSNKIEVLLHPYSSKQTVNSPQRLRYEGVINPNDPSYKFLNPDIYPNFPKTDQSKLIRAPPPKIKQGVDITSTQFESIPAENRNYFREQFLKTGRLPIFFQSRTNKSIPQSGAPDINIIQEQYTPEYLRVTPKPTTIKDTSSGSFLTTPSQSNFPERYNRPFGAAIFEVASNLNPFGQSNTYGLIGTQGFKTYAEKTFYEPFEYVGNPNKIVGQTSNTDTIRRAVNAGVIPEPQSTSTYINARPSDIIQGQTRNLYNEAGVPYTGQPASQLPLRLQETIANNLQNQYGTQLNTGVAQIRDIYQARVNAGEISLGEANAGLKVSSQAYTNSINAQYQNQINAQYNSQIGNLSPKIAGIENYRTQSFEPPAYKYITGAGTVIETGALIGATGFAGSTGSLAASAYLGAKTLYQGTVYQSNYDFLDTKGKIIGGIALAGTAISAGFTANLAISQFNIEQRALIYEGLTNTPATTTYKEVVRAPEYSSYFVRSKTDYGVNTIRTSAIADIYPTEESNVGFFTYGKSNIKIFDPETYKYITNTESFSFGGNVPNIKNDLVNIFSRGNALQGQANQGIGRGAFIQEGKEGYQNIRFTSISQEGNPSVFMTGKPVTTTLTLEGGLTKSRLTGTGTVYNLNADTSNEGGTFIFGGGSKSSSDYFASLYKQVTYQNLAEAGTAQSSTVTAEKAIVQGIIKSNNAKAIPQIINTQSSISSSQSAYAFGQSLNPGYQETSTRERYSLSQPSYQQLVGRQDLGLVNIPMQALDIGTITRQREIITPVLSQPSDQLQQPIQAPTLRLVNPIAPGNPSRGTPNFNPPQIGFGFDLPKPGIDISEYSNTFRGGRKVSGYVPSFSALVFNIGGKYKKGSLAKTGLDFRPVTNAFRINAGGGFLKRFFRKG